MTDIADKVAPRYIHLSVHSEYSTQDGLCKIANLMKQCQAFNMPAIAITDESNFYAAYKFCTQAFKYGIKPIIGLDAWVSSRHFFRTPFRLRLLCKSVEGYRNLSGLLTEAYRHRLPDGHAVLPLESISKTEVIVLSGGRHGPVDKKLAEQHIEEAKTLCQQLREQFGNNFYLELQRFNNTHSSNDTDLINIAAEFNIPVVASNSVCFIDKADRDAQFVRECISLGKSIAEGEPSISDQQYFKSQEEMATLFFDCPEVLTNTVEIAKRCNFYFETGEYYLPTFVTPGDTGEDNYLKQVSQTALEQYSEGKKFSEKQRVDYQQRLDYELQVIVKMGFAGYFLVVADFIQWAKQQAIPVGPGRGSGAGSLVAYILGITTLDPIHYGLLFERFLNPERVSMPDFDVDFCIEGRDRVIDYVSKKYGSTHVSQIITYSTLSSKAVVRDVARALGLPYSLGDQMAKCIPNELGITLSRAANESEVFKQQLSHDEDWQRVYEIALQLEGLPRNVGRHAGGVVIAPENISHYTPLYWDKPEDGPVTHFDKDDLEAIGLVKFDFLGLRNLTVIKHAVHAINKSESAKIELDIDQIPLDDPKTYALIQAANTTAVFQLESSGIKNLMAKLKPDCFEDIVALVALFRPGPLQSGMVNDFIDRKHGLQEVVYPHASLEPILKPTYGIIVYQEQVMQIAQVLAGYSLGQADLLRRAMGKKKPAEMAKQREIFIAGALKNAIEKTLAEYIFDLMEKFAGYGFNRSHSVAYALIAYQTAYLKAHYPTQYMAAVLNTEISNPDKLAIILDECRISNIQIKLPELSEVSAYFIGRSDSIHYGLAAIKGVGLSAAQTLVKAFAGANRTYNYEQILKKCADHHVNEKIIEILIHAGVLDHLPHNRRTLSEHLTMLYKQACQAAQDAQVGQASLFSDTTEYNAGSELSDYDEDPIPDQLNREYELLSCFLSGHPFESYLAQVQNDLTIRLAEIDESLIPRTPSPTPQQYTIAGCIVGLSVYTTRMRDKMAVLVIDDISGRCQVKVFGDVMQQFAQHLKPQAVVLIQGELVKDDRDQSPAIVASYIEPLNKIPTQHTVEITLPHSKKTNKEYKRMILDLLSDYSGSEAAVMVIYKTRDKITEKVPLPAKWNVDLSAEFETKLQTLLGKDYIIIKR